MSIGRNTAFFSHLRRYLIAGLLVWVPIIVTGLILRFMIDLLDYTVLLLPPSLRPETLLGFNVPGSGLVVVILILLTTGLVAANIVGRKMVDMGEAMVDRIPLVNSIYGAVKQLLKTLLHDGGQSFRRVVMVQYPREGLWALGFQTNFGAGEAERHIGKEVMTIFIPTTPNPTSGFVIMVPCDQAVILDMSVEDGLKFVMSLGVITPGVRPWSPGMPGMPGGVGMPGMPGADRVTPLSERPVSPVPTDGSATPQSNPPDRPGGSERSDRSDRSDRSAGS